MTQPEEHAIVAVSPRSGTAPPAEYRWRKGCTSPNPNGRPPAGASVREFLNLLQFSTREEVEAVMNDPAEPVNKVAAARIWRDACSQDRSSAGVPIAGAEIDRIADRTDGRPVRLGEVEPVTYGRGDWGRLDRDELLTVKRLLIKAGFVAPGPSQD